jgi:hypothetical protein
MISRQAQRTLPAALMCLAGVLLLAAGTASGQTNRTAAASVPHALLRDPFWPVGWQPAYVGPVDETKPEKGLLTRWDEAARLLRLTGLSRNADGKYMGIIKGVGAVEEGDVVAVNLAGLTYKWSIRAISPQGLAIDKLGVQPMR